MRAVVQRVRRARVTVGNKTTGEIQNGLLVFLAVAKTDAEAEAVKLAGKIAGLRIFNDKHNDVGGDAGSAGGSNGNDKMNLSVEDAGGSVLVVSQFTLYGDCRKGKRPSFDRSAPAELAESLYRKFIEALRARGLAVETGEFQAMMDVELVNQGPVTLIVDTDRSLY